MLELEVVSIRYAKGYSETYHSLQNLKVICSRFFFCSSPELDAGEAMMDSVWFLVS